MKSIDLKVSKVLLFNILWTLYFIERFLLSKELTLTMKNNSNANGGTFIDNLPNTIHTWCDRVKNNDKLN